MVVTDSVSYSLYRCLIKAMIVNGELSIHNILAFVFQEVSNA